MLGFGVRVRSQGVPHPSGLPGERCRWVLPFSRQFCATAVSLAPLVPWAWKMALLRAWLVRHYYGPCGLSHLVPNCGLERMEFTGASHI